MESYDPTYFAPIAAVEDRHFWFRARNAAIEQVVRQATANCAPGYRVLEVGCGTGTVLRALARACEQGIVTGMDLHPEGLAYARRRTCCALVQGDMRTPPFRAPFDLVGLFDVLEHFEDDLGVLRDLHAMLAPTGRLVLTVPAHAWLWSYFDEGAHHRRRYGLGELKGKLAATGYRVDYVTPYMASILPLVWLRRLRPSRPREGGREADRVHDMTAGEYRIVPGVNALLNCLLTLEARVIARRRRLPFGASLLAVAQRASGYSADRLADERRRCG